MVVEGSDDGEGRTPPVRIAFLTISAVALVAFALVQVASGGERGILTSRLKRLMPQVRAEVVDAPMSEQQREWPLTASDGRTLTLAQLPRDRLVFLNFWATWCEPCTRELPSMRQLVEALDDRAFMMVAVSYDEEWADITAFFTRWLGRMPDPRDMLLLKDPILDEGHTLRETFGTKPIPDSYLILDGRVIARFVNARDWTDPTIVELIRMLAPPRPGADEDGT